MNNRRTAILMLKYLHAHGKTADDNEINKFTDDDFEQVFIPLAAYWSNDMIDLCFASLNIEQPSDAFNTEMSKQWYAWFEKTVNELELPSTDENRNEAYDDWAGNL